MRLTPNYNWLTKHSHVWLSIQNDFIWWRRQWHPTPVLVLGKSHGRRSLVGHGVTKSQTWLSGFIFTFHFHALEKEMTTHSSVLAWRIPGTGEPGGLLSMGSHRVGHDWSDLAAAAAVLFGRLWDKAAREQAELLKETGNHIMEIRWNRFLSQGVIQGCVVLWCLVSSSILRQAFVPRQLLQVLLVLGSFYLGALVG